MSAQGNRLFLTGRFTEAIEYVRQLHTEFRKGTDIPYMAHLLGVAALVMGEAGGRVLVTEDMVIAALLHDVVEDHGGLSRLREVEGRFGANVAAMVAGLSDSFVESGQPKEEWKKRKCEYIERLRGESDEVLLISAADKLYNAKAILDDFKEIGEAIWGRFKRGADEQLWYFKELIAIYLSRSRNRIVNDLERVMDDLTALALKPETDVTSAAASLPTTMNICPIPARWKEVYETLARKCSEQVISTAPPKPLILAGWAYSNDVEKADRWRETVIWAEQNGFSEFTRIEPDDWYSVGQPSSYEIGPLGGPMHLPWRFEPVLPPSADEAKLALAKLAENWARIAGTLAEYTRPLRICGKKMRRLIVKRSSSAPPPPWGDWNRLAKSDSRRAFTEFRRAVNATVSPLEIDHIDFEQQD